MKKRWNFLFCAALLCILCACGGQASQAEAPSAPEDGGEPAAQSAPAPAETEPAQDPVAPEEETALDQPEPAAASGEEALPVEDVQVPKTDTPDQAPPPAKSPQPAAQTEKPKEQQPAPKPAPQPEPKPEPKPDPEPEPKPEPEPEPAPAADPKTVAQGLVGRPVSELYAAIGRPISSDYAPSCLIDGEDGELVYDGFVVYTEKGADYETVYAVF